MDAPKTGNGEVVANLKKTKPKKKRGVKKVPQPGPRGPSGDCAQCSKVPAPTRAPVRLPGPVLTPMGTVCVVLRRNLRVHISPSGWVLLVNGNIGGMAGVDPEGRRSGLRHPSGSVHQESGKIHVAAVDGKRAFVSQRGITFCARLSAESRLRVKPDHGKHEGQLAYVLDDGGPRTTVASFAPFDDDFVVNLIAVGNTSSNKQRCEVLLRESQESREQAETTENSDSWIVGGIRVVQLRSGDCFVKWDKTSCHLKASPDRGTLAVNTQDVYTTASIPPDPHLFVRNKSRRVHHDGRILVVRNGSHVAALGANGEFTLL